MSFRKIIMGTAAMSSVSALRLLSQFLVIPILSRLLSPTDYGLMAIAMPFVLFTMMFADAGVGRSLVRTPSVEKDVWSTCFWLSIILGFFLGLIMIAVAPVAAAIFHEPELQPIIMSLSVVIFAQAVSTIPGAALQQHHKFKAIAAIEMAGLVTGIVVAIGVALAGGGAWALVGQQIAFYIVRGIMAFWCAPFMPLRVFSLKLVKEHLVFGRDIIGVAIVQLISRSADNLIIGKILGSAVVGVYSMAFQFARLPVILVTGPLQYVLYAQLAQIKHNVMAVSQVFLLLTRILAIVIFPVMGMAAVAHQPIFKWLLSEKWTMSGEIFMIAAGACALQTLTGLGGTIMMVLGRTEIQFKVTAEFAALWVVSLLIAVWYGLDVSTMTYNIVVLAYTPRLLMLLLPIIQCSMGKYLHTILTPAVIALVCILTYMLLNRSLELSQWPQILLSALLALIGVGISALVQKNQLATEISLCRKALIA